MLLMVELILLSQSMHQAQVVMTRLIDLSTNLKKKRGINKLRYHILYILW